MKTILKNIIVLLAVIATLLLTSCSESEDGPATFCKTINSKESKLEYVGNNAYATKYYFFLDSQKTEVTKEQYENNKIGSQLCKTLDY